MLQAGKLKHRLKIQYPVETRDTNDGAVIVTWTDLATVWGGIEPMSAREFVASQSLDSEIDTRITIRYRAGITAKMRFHHVAKNTYYNIEGTLSDKDSGYEYLTLPCSSGVKDG